MVILCFSFRYFHKLVTHAIDFKDQERLVQEQKHLQTRIADLQKESVALQTQTREAETLKQELEVHSSLLQTKEEQVRQKWAETARLHSEAIKEKARAQEHNTEAQYAQNQLVVDKEEVFSQILNCFYQEN